jgi:hypothetical protein
LQSSPFNRLVAAALATQNFKQQRQRRLPQGRQFFGNSSKSFLGVQLYPLSWVSPSLSFVQQVLFCILLFFNLSPFVYITLVKQLPQAQITQNNKMKVFFCLVLSLYTTATMAFVLPIGKNNLAQQATTQLSVAAEMVSEDLKPRRTREVR